jgi:uncharacterized protein (TIGR01777 family)
MKVLITGATGLVGKALRQLYKEQGVGVHYLSTSKRKLQKGYGQGFYWNPARNEIDLAAFDGVTHLVNLAGASIAQRWTAAHRKRILNSRVNSLQLLHKGITEAQPSGLVHFLSASAIGRYPHSFTREYTEEVKEVDKSFLGEVVEAWEEAANPFSEFEFSTCLLRIGIVLDPLEGALPKLVGPVKKGVGAPLGSGKQWQSWIHLEDLVGMILFAQKTDWKGVYNGVAPEPVRQKQLTQAIAKSLKKPLWLPAVPSFVLRLLLGEMAYIALASQYVSSDKAEQAGFVFRYPRLEQALEELFS